MTGRQGGARPPISGGARPPESVALLCQLIDELVELPDALTEGAT